MEILLQIILEPIFFAYFDLVQKIFEGKKIKKGLEYFLKILCAVISFTSFMLVILGAFWITDKAPFKTYGTIMLIIGVCILFIHIIIGLFAGINHFVQEKREDESLNRQIFEEHKPTPIIRYIQPNDKDEDKN